LKSAKLLIIVIIGLMLIQCTVKSELPQNLRVMTFNIRLNLPSDGVNAWPKRKDKVADIIHFYHPEMFGVQEAFAEQVEDLAQRIPDYQWLGVGRDDGQKAGEYMAIFYKSDRLKVLKQATFWLSENPDQPGLGWDAAYNRVVTWAHFEDNYTAKHFYHFNTHFDNRGEIARQQSASLLLKKIKEIAGNKPIIVTGDFNTGPESQTYKILTEQQGSQETLILIDAKTVSRLPHEGPSRTFNGFDPDALKTEAEPIDYIFVQNQIEVLSHATLADTFHGFFPSDHMPVLTELRIN